MSSVPAGDIASTVLVITAPADMIGPLAYNARCRQTLGVLTELIATASDRLIISAPFLQPGAGISAGVLNAALRAALRRGVAVELVTTGQSLSGLDIASFRSTAPGHLRVSRPTTNVLDPKTLGSHAKFCVSDGIAAYIGSANLTGPGLAEHIELGVLVRGPLAKQVEEFWTLCQQLGLFVGVDAC
jgi:phosphatidylserine/phosphatidylglycerophosphate/cardiolipin synthase-like enzyme